MSIEHESTPPASEPAEPQAVYVGLMSDQPALRLVTVVGVGLHVARLKPEAAQLAGWQLSLCGAMAHAWECLDPWLDGALHLTLAERRQAFEAYAKYVHGLQGELADDATEEAET